MKLPFSISLKFVFRVVLPGFILSAGLLPLLQYLCAMLDIQSDIGTVLAVTTLLFGWFFVISDSHIYMILEGRRYWPEFLWEIFYKSECKRLQKIKNVHAKALKTSKETGDKKATKDYLELSVEIRRFPMSADGEYEAQLPTRLGNLIYSYEEYPYRAYGMDPVFYWYRIWLKMDNELRQEIDDPQALTDSALYSVAALSLLGCLYFAYALYECGEYLFSGYWNEPSTCVILGTLAWFLGYAVYRMSLHIHAQYGEVFKSVFDNFNNRINVEPIIGELNRIFPDEKVAEQTRRQKFITAWRFLHNYKFKNRKGELTNMGQHNMMN